MHRGAYADSVQLMSATRSMREQEGVGWAAALMGTPANLEALAAEGFAWRRAGRGHDRRCRDCRARAVRRPGTQGAGSHRHDPRRPGLRRDAAGG